MQILNAFALRIDIKALAEKVSERYNIFIGELRSGGRRRAVVKARCAMLWISGSLLSAVSPWRDQRGSFA